MGRLRIGVAVGEVQLVQGSSSPGYACRKAPCLWAISGNHGGGLAVHHKEAEPKGR